ncbi:MAG: hypothetical protein L6Q35_03480 [Phycisphaerales bacterium]|nr:hypothetical protein [Phycisphaerales bacterium]
MTHITRRDFSVTATLAAAGWLVSGSRPPRAVAGPFGPEDLAVFPVPADKKLDPQWLASLSARGAPIEYRSSRDELSYIGMPIGGICTGLLYLGGDGKLWLWDIFNQPAAPTWGDSSGPHYAKPVQQTSPLVQNFGLRVTAGGQTTHRNFDITGWADIAFRGEYPIGKVEYRQPGLPVEASLEAFSPFCPLEPDDSGLPATVMNFTVRNTSAEPVEIAVAGWMQNAVCLASEPDFDLVRHVRVKRQNGLIRADLSAAIDPRAEERRKQERPPVVFDRFESDRYENWETTGEAFGDGPRLISSLPGYMGQVNGEGQRVVNTHHTQNGEDVGKADTYVGTLLSREFTIERRFISFRFGGGNHPGQTAFNLLVDGAPVRTTTGRNSNFMQLHNWDVTEFEGRKARLQAVDAWTGGWGQIGLDDVVFCDSPRRESGRLEDRGDYGTLSLGMIVPPGTVVPGLFSFDSVNAQSLPAAAFTGDADSTAARPIASIGRSVTLKPGESQTFTFTSTGCGVITSPACRAVTSCAGTTARVSGAPRTSWTMSPGRTNCSRRAHARGTRAGTTRRFPGGCCTGRWRRPRRSRPRPASASTTTGSTRGRAPTAARARARTSGPTRTRSAACSRSSSDRRARWPITASRSTRTPARWITEPSTTRSSRTTASAARSCAPTASTRCRPTTRSSGGSGRASGKPSST